MANGWIGSRNCPDVWCSTNHRKGERPQASLKRFRPARCNLLLANYSRNTKWRWSFGSEAHLKEVLATFDLKRLTKPVAEKLREILGNRYSYVDDSLDGG